MGNRKSKKSKRKATNQEEAPIEQIIACSNFLCLMLMEEEQGDIRRPTSVEAVCGVMQKAFNEISEDTQCEFQGIYFPGQPNTPDMVPKARSEA
jgi:hypothetical protein